MADATETIRKGEKRPFFGTLSVESGTLTINGTPTVTLYDAQGNAVASVNGANATGYDVTAAASVRAWYVLDTAALDRGRYTLVFTITATGSDGIQRIEEPNVRIEIGRPWF